LHRIKEKNKGIGEGDNVMTNEGEYRDTYSGTLTTDTTAGTWWEYTTPYYELPQQPVIISTPFVYPTPLKNNKKGDDDMRYLYEVILVNPKNDTFSEVRIVAKSETSALMKAYDATQFRNKINKTLIGNLEGVDFDDLKTSCRVLMEWKKEKSLKKAIETIKKAVE